MRFCGIVLLEPRPCAKGSQTSLCGGMPVGGSFSRGAVNAEAGARTRAAGARAALLMALTMLLLSAPLAWLPKAVLAASIVMAVLSVVEWRAFAEA